MNNRYNVPSCLPLNQYGHVNEDLIPEAKTDPYGNLEYATGNPDDFVCFDFAVFQHGGETYVALHSTLNCESASFIEDFDYVVLRYSLQDEGELLQAAADMVSAATDWRIENQVRHDKTGWNQDPFYFVRSLACSFYRFGLDAERLQPFLRKSSWFRYGSKTLNRQIEAISHKLNLPVTRPPKRASFSEVY